MKIVIIEDHLMFREVLRKVCTDELGFTVVGESADGGLAIEVVQNTRPDLVLLDLHLPTLDGFSIARLIRKYSEKIRILVLSSHCDEYSVFCAEQLRVQGFVDKNTNSVETLKSAIGAVAGGRTWYSEAFLRIKLARRSDSNSFDKILSAHEQTLVAMLGYPLPDEQVAESLGITVESVVRYRFTLLRKLNLESQTDLIRFARERGFTLTVPKGDVGALLP